MTVGFDVFDRWFWCYWQQVLMILTGGFDGFDVLTAGFDGFDVLTAGFDVFDDFDSWFWWFWCFDSRFWCFWWFWQEVLVFEGCIINDRRFCLLKTLLSGNSTPTRRIPYQHIWGCAVKNCEVHPPQTSVLFKTKDQAYISPLTPEVKVRENFKTRKSEYIIYKRVQKIDDVNQIRVKRRNRKQ